MTLGSQVQTLLTLYPGNIIYVLSVADISSFSFVGRIENSARFKPHSYDYGSTCEIWSDLTLSSTADVNSNTADGPQNLTSVRPRFKMMNIGVSIAWKQNCFTQDSFSYGETKNLTRSFRKHITVINGISKAQGKKISRRSGDRKMPRASSTSNIKGGTFALTFQSITLRRHRENCIRPPRPAQLLCTSSYDCAFSFIAHVESAIEDIEGNVPPAMKEEACSKLHTRLAEVPLL